MRRSGPPDPLTLLHRLLPAALLLALLVQVLLLCTGQAQASAQAIAPAAPAAVEQPPGPNLTTETRDLGNGYGQTLYRDLQGGAYDLGLIFPLPGTLTARPLAPSSGGSVPDLIVSASRRWDLDATQMLRIAWCESKFDPAAYNRRSGASGLFQFLSGTWATSSRAVGMAGASPFDPVANVEAAAWLMKTEGPRHWVCT